MHWNRRQWLRLLLAASLLAAAGLVTLPRQLRIRLRAITDRERQAVTRIVDLLVPDDEAPGALALGIDREVLARLESSRWDARWVAEAILWLDAQAIEQDRAAFVDLGADLQIALLERAESAPSGTAPARAFQLLRNAAISGYYARPEAWPALGFDGPPQPRGFLNYAEPPRTAQA